MTGYTRPVPTAPLQPLAVLNVVGLSKSLLQHAPNLRALTADRVTTLRPVLPAVTCSVQSSMLTGRSVADHGVVGNGWFNRELNEIQFWKQSNALVHGEKVWDTARRRAQAQDQRFTCANLFWWFNMGSSVDISVTPRPQYHADGRKVPDIYTTPAELRDELQQPQPRGLGRFPLFNFWGPGSNLTSSQWIADATQRVVSKFDPTLTLVYLPHLDYGLQKLGPDHADIPHQVADIDRLAGELIDFLQDQGRRVLVVSEYGIEPVHTAIPVNRYLREAGLLAVRDESGHELLDPVASRAFAVADHQVAHVYHDPELSLPSIPGCTATSINHPRAGETVLVADPGHWFTYDYWIDDARAPDFARTVEIHRKPGYDPRELFLGVSKASVAWKLFKRKLGLRQTLEVIPLDPGLVKGSHGRVEMPADLQPVLLGAETDAGELPCEAVHDVILETLFPPG